MNILTDNPYWFVGGPNASFIVFDKLLIEPLIAATCKENGDDPDDYTATELGATMRVH